jgi:antitoxin VapB
MPLQIRNVETEHLVERLAALTGETPAVAIAQALRERLDRMERLRNGRRLADELDAIACATAKLPVRDPRSADEILGYGPDGLPR